MSQPAAAERPVLTCPLPRGGTLRLVAGHRGHGYTPVRFAASRGGRGVGGYRTPWGAYRALLQWERQPVRPM